MLEKCVLTVLELNCNQRLGHRWTKLNICHHMLTSSTQLQTERFISCRRKNENVCEMSEKEKCTCKACKNCLSFVVKYANMWGFCCRRRRGFLNSPINMSSKLLTAIPDDFICCVEALPRYRIIRFELYPYVITSRSDVELFFLVATISIFFALQVL